MTTGALKKFTEKDYDELKAEISALKSSSSEAELFRLKEKLLPVLASLYQQAPDRWHDEYSAILMQTSIGTEVIVKESEKIHRLDLALSIFIEHIDDGKCFFGLWGLILDSSPFSSQTRNKRMIELFERQIDNAEQLQKKYPKIWSRDYLKMLNDFATIYVEESQFDKAFIQFKKYFEVFDSKHSDKIEDFIYPWVKFNQSALNSDNVDQHFLDNVCAKHVEFYKNDLGRTYSEKMNQILSEYQVSRVKNSNPTMMQERFHLFRKIFIVDGLLGI